MNNDQRIEIDLIINRIPNNNIHNFMSPKLHCVLKYNTTIDQM